MLTSHRLTLTGLALACFAGFASAQTASEVVALTCPSTQIDMDNVGPVGPCFNQQCPVTVAQLNAAGVPAPGLLTSLTCTRNPSSAATGTYNTTLNGRAVACATSSSTTTPISIHLMDVAQAAGTSTYVSSDYCLTFQHNHTGFGLATGDWNGPLTLEFYDGDNCTGNLVARIATTSNFTTATKFFQVTGGGGGGPPCFRSVAVRAPDVQRAANFVITEIWTERLVGGITDPTPSFNTCVGSNGQMPTLTAVAVTATPAIPEKCQRLQIIVANGVPGSPAQGVLNGGIPAPISLGVIGGDPNCFVKIPLFPVPIFLPPVALGGGGGLTFSTNVPARLCGGTLLIEYWLADFGKPQAIKATTTNQIAVTIQ